MLVSMKLWAADCILRDAYIRSTPPSLEDSRLNVACMQYRIEE